MKSIDDKGPNPSGLCECGCGSVTGIARKSDSRRGWVAGRHNRYISGHNYRPHGTGYLIDDVTGCWVWQGRLGAGGYGRVSHNGRPVAVHRRYYEILCGPIPAGFHVHHRCRNRACVNPDHLVAVDKRAHGGKDADLEYWKSRALTAERAARFLLEQTA
jgi:hypothetical protein